MPTQDEMIAAVRDGDEARVAGLLAADPALAAARAPSGDSAVLLAVYYGRREILARLLESAPPLTIFEAAAAGEPGRVAALLREDPALARARSHDGWSALHLAAFFGNVAAAESLLAAGADVHAWAENGQRNQPLHAAAAGNHADIVSLLLIAGADPRSPSAEGFTALHSAAQNGSAAIAAALLDAGADPAATAADGRTPAALAAAAGHPAVADLIRRRGG